MQSLTCAVCPGGGISSGVSHSSASSIEETWDFTPFMYISIFFKISKEGWINFFFFFGLIHV